MLLKNQILAGEVLEYLEITKISASLEILASLMDVPLHNLQIATEILIADDLVTWDFRDNSIALASSTREANPDIQEKMLYDLITV